jgi:hypothetical protein
LKNSQFSGILFIKSLVHTFYFERKLKQMDKISRTKGISSGSKARVTLDQFRKTSQEHLELITQTQKSLQKASVPFQGKGDVLPVHCKLALDSLKEMNGCIEEFGGLFYKTRHLPLVIIALRYQTMLILHRIETQSSQLEELLDSYRTICTTPSKHAYKRRNTISDSFEELLQSLTDISQQVGMLNDESRFHQGRLMTIGE